MSNIDIVTDLTFSQPLSTADDVAKEILTICGNNKRERSMPPISGLLTTVSYLLPAVGRILRPLLEKKGRSVKRQLKAEMYKASQKEAS